ncbi:hypothetical protein [Hydrogenophaga sp.]|uniref:hypothetical protein n=1 Tax=Hydrogenophaga sp. TaxID=1904254 RepID=UPI002722A116|nr:hypothetical protein [Hydrogenophaga sp.]MDO9436733.1 hypothetical protein [Hydrogenophaga sp.]
MEKTTPPVNDGVDSAHTNNTWGFAMFWISGLVLTLLWMAVKLGAMSATVGFLGFALKALLLLLAVLTLVGAVVWLRKKNNKRVV